MSKFYRRLLCKRYGSNASRQSPEKPNAVASAAAQVIESLEPRCLLSVSFGAPITTALENGQTPLTFASADLNGDGIPDLVIGTTSSGSTNVDLVFLGNGDGTFTAGQTVVLQPSLSNVPVLALADINHDNHVDILQGAFVAGGTEGGIGIALGNGDGTFTDADSFATLGSTPLSLAVADLNHDGNLDLLSEVVGTSSAPNGQPLAGVDFKPGNGDGSFKDFPEALQTKVSDAGLLADFTGNGPLDLATSNGVQQGNGDGTFKSAIAYPTGNGLGLLLSADFNGDGSPDIALAPDYTQTSMPGSINILINQGGLHFSATTIPISASDLAGMTLADVNGDGKTDIIATVGPNSADHANSIALMTGNGDGTFAAPIYTPIGSDGGPVLVADVRGTGQLDIVVLNPAANTVSVLPNQAIGVSSTTVTSNVATAVTGDPVQFTATIHGGGSSKPTGTVTFLDGTTAIGTAPVQSDGTAVFATSSLAAGTHSITASYGGDSRFGPSTSAALTETIQTPAEHNAGDVSVQISQLQLPSIVVPGDKGAVTFVLTNNGSKTVAGRIAIQLFASTNGKIDSSSTQVALPSLQSKAINLKPSKSIKIKVRFIVPLTLQPANYKFLAQVIAGSGITSADVFGGVFTSSSVKLVTQFGTVGNRHNVTLLQQNSDGTQSSFSLSGPGTGTWVSNTASLSLNGTTGASQLKILNRGGNHLTSINTVTVNGSLRKFLESTVSGLVSLNVSGSIGLLAGGNLSNASIQFGSAGKVTLGTLTDTTLKSTGSIGSLSVTSWTGTSNNVLAAKTIGTLTSKGEFDPTLNIHGPGLVLKSARIGGGVASAQWALHGSVGSIQINGALNNAGIFAGTDFGADNARGGGDDIFDAGSIKSLVIDGNLTNALIGAGLNSSSNGFLPGSSIGVIFIKGTLDTNSTIVAASLPPVVVVNGSPVNTATDPHFKL